MSPWQDNVGLFVACLYMGAWWVVVDMTWLRRHPFWHFVTVAFLSLYVLMIIADLTFGTPTLHFLVGGWVALPFAVLVWLAWSGRFAVWGKAVLRGDDPAK